MICKGCTWQPWLGHLHLPVTGCQYTGKLRPTEYQATAGPNSDFFTSNSASNMVCQSNTNSRPNSVIAGPTRQQGLNWMGLINLIPSKITQVRNHKRPNVGPVLANILPRLGASTGPLPKWYLRAALGSHGLATFISPSLAASILANYDRPSNKPLLGRTLVFLLPTWFARVIPTLGPIKCHCWASPATRLELNGINQFNSLEKLPSTKSQRAQRWPSTGKDIILVPITLMILSFSFRPQTNVSEVFKK